MDSFAVCTVGPGAIIPETDGQVFLDIETYLLLKYMDEKYPGLREILEDPYGSLYLTEGMAELALQFLSDTMDTRGGMVNLEYFGDDLVDVYVRVALERLVPGVDASSPHGLLDGTRGMVDRSDIRNGADGAYLDEKFMEVLRAYSAGYGGLVAEGGMHRFQEENRVYLATVADMVSGLAFCALAFQYATPKPKKEISDSNPDPKDLRDGEVAASKGSGNLKPQELMDELAKSGVKYNADDIVAITKMADGKLVWLENGNSHAGLKHILNHADEFATKGISPSQLPDFITKAVSEGNIVGYQGAGTGRPIYEVIYNGQTQRVAITTGSNGFIVGTNPVSLP